MIRLTLLILLFLASLLAIIKPPTYHLWMLAIGVAEFAWVFAFITLILLVLGFVTGQYQLLGSLFGLAALVIFLTPVFRACLVARQLPSAMTEALGEDGFKMAPLSLETMVAGSGYRPVPCRTFTYRADTACMLQMDFYPSQLPGPRPCVIVIHGGSWSSGDSRALPELNSYLAHMGYHVAAINYRLAPEYLCPSPIEDVYSAMDYLRRNRAGLEIDTNNFVLLGRSAGAQVALLAAYRQPVPGLKGVIDFYGPADMVWGYSAPANRWVMDSKRVLENYLGGTYAAVPQQYINSSPIEFVSRNSVPTLILHGEHDVLVAYEHSTRLSKRLAANGVKHFFLSLPWATHGFDYNINGPGGQLSTYAITRFLRTVIYSPTLF
jgi:acetyl esterase/lipase